MSKNIVITEKPSVAMEYVKALRLSASDKKDGYYENEKWVITWTVGHLISMSYPDKYDKSLAEWKLDTLPFLPDEYRYEVISNVKKQFKIVKFLYNRSDIDTIFYAGDSGREGLYIQMLVRQEAGHSAGVKEAVVWIDSPTEDEILNGIAQAKDISTYENMKNAGYMRAIEDYVVGINFSRLLSVKYAAMLNTGSNQKHHKPISVGRVMTCVLGMIVSREREIRNFKVQNFYRIAGKIDINGSEIGCEWRVSDDSKYFNSPKLYSKFGFKESSDADDMIGSLTSKLMITKVEKSKKKKSAPLLYNLAELQSDCSKKLHISPGKTLQIAQNLYEKKLTTYPRTDARVLSSAVAEIINKNLVGLSKGAYSGIVDIIRTSGYNLGNRYIDDSKITDHYAIIPTGILPNELNEQEKTVYDMICRRFFSCFYPCAEFETVSFEGVCGLEHFYGSSKYMSYAGFYDVLGVPDDYKKDNNESLVVLIGNLVEGSEYLCNFYKKDGKTQAPNRYSTGSMILAMENAGTLIEDEELREQISGCGIGTSATRAEVIDKLIKLNYVNSNDKTQILTPTNFGEMVYEVVDSTIPRLLEPKITAEWEKELDDVSKGNLSIETFKDNLYDFVKSACENVKTLDNSDDVFKRIRPFASGVIRNEYVKFENWDTSIKCPLCGNDIETTSWGFKCVGNISKAEGCTFSIGDIMGHRLLTPELKKLLTEGKCGPFYDFISSKGKVFGAYLIWNDDTKKIDFDFVDMPWEKTEFKCPCCGKDVVKQGNMYKCVDFIDFDNGCKFFVGKILGKSLSDKHIEKLCKHEKTDLIKGFKKKNNSSTFDAYLKWSDSDNRIMFDFPTNDDMRTKYKCPECGGSILATSYGYRCERYKSLEYRGNSDCCFIVGKILGHTIKEKELETLVLGGITELIEGFKPKDKDKKPFAAKLRYSKEDKSIIFVFDEDKPVDMGISCPNCGNKVIKTRYGYFCSENKGRDKGCSFGFSSYLGVKLDDVQFKKLMNMGKTDLIKGFKPKDFSKKPFSAFLVFDKENSQFRLEFPEFKSNVSDYMCPKCHSKKLIDGDFSLRCDCGFKLSKVIAEKSLSEDNIKQLISRGETDIISGFYSAKKRNRFSAKLKVNDNGIEFVFPEKK